MPKNKNKKKNKKTMQPGLPQVAIKPFYSKVIAKLAGLPRRAQSALLFMVVFALAGVGYLLFSRADSCTTVPTQFAAGGIKPFNIAVDSNSNIWYGESSSNQVGKLANAKSSTAVQFAMPSGSSPGSVAIDSKGNVWFTEYGTNKIGELTASTITANPSGSSVTTLAIQYTLPSGAQPTDIAVDKNNNVWFTESGTSKIGELRAGSTSSTVAIQYTLPNGANPEGLTIDSSGNVWFAEEVTNQIGEIPVSLNSSITITQYVLPSNSAPQYLAFDQKGNLWFTEHGSGNVGELPAGSTTSTVATQYPGVGAAYGITVDAGGNVWFAEYNSNQIGELPAGSTTSMVALQFATPSGSAPYGITTDSGGNIWFTERGSNQIGELPVNSRASCSAPISSTLYAGQQLAPGQSLTAPNGQFQVFLQNDGNVVVYNTSNQAIWSDVTGFGQTPASLVMQTNGDLVEYNTSGKSVWDSHTAGSGSSNYLTMQNDGNLVIYTKAGQMVWSSNGGIVNTTLNTNLALYPGQYLESQNGLYRFYLQTDGNIVTYNLSNQALWAGYTGYGQSPASLIMEGDGNLVEFNTASQSVWNSGTAGSGSGNFLTLGNDGNLIMYNASGQPVWSSNGGIVNTTLNTNLALYPGQYLESQNGLYRFYLQTDGNIVTYNLSNQALWAGYTGYGQSPASLIMEGDGNLVEFNTASQSVWNSGTAGSGSGNYLVMQNDGDLVMYTADGTPVWSSQTGAIASASVPAGSLNAYPGTVQSNHRSVLKWNQPGVTCSAPFYLGTLPGSGSYTTNPLSGPGGSYYIGCKANPPQTYAYIRQVNVNALPTTPSSPPPFSSQPAIVSGTISLINNYRATYSEPALSEARCLDAAASKYALYLATIHAPTVPEINSDTLNSDIANACGSSYIKAGSNTGANAGESWVADSSDASIATANTGIFNSMVGEKLCYAVVNITCPDDHRINILSYIKYPFVYNFNQIGVGAYYDPATQDLFVTTFFAQP